MTPEMDILSSSCKPNAIGPPCVHALPGMESHVSINPPYSFTWLSRDTPPHHTLPEVEVYIQTPPTLPLIEV